MLKGSKVDIHLNTRKAILKKTSNWKTSGLDDIHRFWIKIFLSVHDRLATEMYKFIQKTKLLEWMTNGETTLIQKILSKKLP